MKKKKFLLLSLIPLSLIMLGACKEKNDNNEVEDITSTIENKQDNALLVTFNDDYATIVGLPEESMDLTEITIPSYFHFDDSDYEVTTIAPNAFKGNKKIEVVNIPTTVRYIKDEAFAGAINLKEVNFIDENGNKSSLIDKKSKLSEIGIRAFANTKIEKFVFSKMLEIVSAEAFYNTNLKTLTLYGKDVHRRFDNAFYNTKLESVTDESENNRLKLENGLLTYGGSLIYADINLEEIDIPSNVTTISYGALSHSNLKKVKLNNVKYIYDSAFAGSKIEEIIGGEFVEYIEYNAFWDTKFTVNKEKLVLGSVLALDYINTNTYVVDDNIKSISYVRGQAEKIIIKSNVENIGAYAFSKVSGLEKVYFQSVYGNPSIGNDNAFKDSVNLIIPYNTDRYYKENNHFIADRFTTENINITFYKNDEKLSTVSIPYGSFLSEYIPNGYKSVKDKDGNVYNKGNMLLFIGDTNLYLYESDVTWE
ncbi:MAG: leucine-rich repeat domain-containing protein [Acholeplasmatales bacterium]|nr:leucine-rich repeat domain-containing protein [Acholeplasmatales bacterium]